MEKYKPNIVLMIMGGLFFFAAAMLILIMTVQIGKWSDFKERAVSVSAEITDIQVWTESSGDDLITHHDVYIEYEYGGRSFNEMLNYSVKGKAVGDELTVLIDPDAPSENMTAPWEAVGICSILFLAFGGIGLGLPIHELRTSAYINGLIRENKYVLAEYLREESAGDDTNYVHSVFVYDDGFGHTVQFRSRPHSPSKRPYADGEWVKVYVDMEKDPRKHYISSGKQ